MSLPVPKNSGPKTIIARLDPIKNSWTYLGDLKDARKGHSVIQVESQFIVVGGELEESTRYAGAESCILNGESMMCNSREPRKMKSFKFYPELMLMP